MESFDFPNEGTIITDPCFVCDSCGFANVKLLIVNDLPAAKCTSCGAGYLETDSPFTEEA